MKWISVYIVILYNKKNLLSATKQGKESHLRLQKLEVVEWNKNLHCSLVSVYLCRAVNLRHFTNKLSRIFAIMSLTFWKNELSAYPYIFRALTGKQWVRSLENLVEERKSDLQSPSGWGHSQSTVVTMQWEWIVFYNWEKESLINGTWPNNFKKKR